MSKTMQSLAMALSLALGLATLACRTNQTPEAQVNDAKITAAVKAKLASDVRPATLTNVSVDTTNGVVTLSGQVSSAEERRRIEEVARGVAGVRSVNNNLQVQGTAAP